MKKKFTLLLFFIVSIVLVGCSNFNINKDLDILLKYNHYIDTITEDLNNIKQCKSELKDKLNSSNNKYDMNIIQTYSTKELNLTKKLISDLNEFKEYLNKTSNMLQEDISKEYVSKVNLYCDLMIEYNNFYIDYIENILLKQHIDENGDILFANNEENFTFIEKAKDIDTKQKEYLEKISPLLNEINTLKNKFL